MGAEGRTDHDTAADQGIARLLAEAADGVRIGAVPYRELVRGGRRRRARRWALAAAAALVVAGSTGVLASAGGAGGEGRRVVPAATTPAPPDYRQADKARSTAVARGTDHTGAWTVEALVWEPPRNAAEARAQLTTMKGYGLAPAGVHTPADLVGKGWYYGRLMRDGGTALTFVNAPEEKGGAPAAGQVEAAATLLDPDAGGGSRRLLVGRVAPTVREVTCTWADGTKVRAAPAAPGTGLVGDFEDLIRPVEGSRANWFTCVAPAGADYRSGEARVTKEGAGE
ncbi:hypothetical protein AB0912_12560 [Streptomyces sp. NPDC007084]|uniref:hypothetical protein n=1 Tax=Streptomyces sp. NPDC007084 TaxID=3154313 RepID=UPI003451DC7F